MVDSLLREVLMEYHHSKMIIHPERDKMYKDMEIFFWFGMKKSVAEFVAKCLTC